MGIVNSTNDRERDLDDAKQEIQEVGIMYLDIKNKSKLMQLKRQIHDIIFEEKEHIPENIYKINECYKIKLSLFYNIFKLKTYFKIHVKWCRKVPIHHFLFLWLLINATIINDIHTTIAIIPNIWCSPNPECGPGGSPGTISLGLVQLDGILL